MMNTRSTTTTVEIDVMVPQHKIEDIYIYSPEYYITKFGDVKDAVQEDDAYDFGGQGTVFGELVKTQKMIETRKYYLEQLVQQNKKPHSTELKKLQKLFDEFKTAIQPFLDRNRAVTKQKARDEKARKKQQALEKQQKKEQEKQQRIVWLKEQYQKNIKDAEDLAQLKSAEDQFKALYAFQSLGLIETDHLEPLLEQKLSITYTDCCNQIKQLHKNDRIGQCPITHSWKEGYYVSICARQKCPVCGLVRDVPYDDDELGWFNC